MAFISGEIEYAGSKVDGKKGLPLCILQVLMDHSDPDNPLRSADIIRKLAENYGIETNRNTVSRNIALLRELSFEINCYEDDHKGYFLKARAFDPIEIRWLIDAVLNSKYLTERYADDLINKLKKLGSSHFKSGMDHVSALREWPHQNNPAFSDSMELLDGAIDDCCRVRFTYNQMDCDGMLHPYGDEIHEALPIRMFCVNFQYYLVAHEFKGYDLTHFRLDRITNLTVAGEKLPGDCALRDKLDIDAVRYAREHPHMYGGRAVPVTMKMPRTLAGAVYDAFGRAASMSALDDVYMRVRVRAAAEGMRFFALQFGPNCEVLDPPELREQVRVDIKNMMERYGG